jgi:hypothetical protein
MTISALFTGYFERDGHQGKSGQSSFNPSWNRFAIIIKKTIFIEFAKLFAMCFLIIWKL